MYIIIYRRISLDLHLIYPIAKYYISLILRARSFKVHGFSVLYKCVLFGVEEFLTNATKVVCFAVFEI